MPSALELILAGKIAQKEPNLSLIPICAQGGKTLPGLSTGFSAVAGKINGLTKSDLLLLAARPGMGKTCLLYTSRCV